MGVVGMWHGRGVVLARSWQDVLNDEPCTESSSLGPERLQQVFPWVLDSKEYLEVQPFHFVWGLSIVSPLITTDHYS